jgi:hypothetical protein
LRLERRRKEFKMQVPTLEQVRARNKVEIWCKRLRVFEDRCLRRSIHLSGDVSEIGSRLEEASEDNLPIYDVTELREGLHTLSRRRLDEDHDAEWVEVKYYKLQAFLDPGKLILADIIAFIETPEIRMMLGPVLSEMDGEELEVADRNRLYYGRSTLTSL